MQNDKDKYSDITGILKRSKPVLKDPGEIENNVMRIISARRKPAGEMNDLLDSVFGWAYIGWLRRSLVTASVVIVAVFTYQQGIILKKINYLEQKTVYAPSAIQTGAGGSEPAAVLKRFRLFGPGSRMTEKEIRELLDSYNDLDVRYKELLKTINDDPDLKKYFNDKFPGFDKEKIKL